MHELGGLSKVMPVTGFTSIVAFCLCGRSAAFGGILE
jgi:hypothetical protein